MVKGKHDKNNKNPPENKNCKLELQILDDEDLNIASMSKRDAKVGPKITFICTSPTKSN